MGLKQTNEFRNDTVRIALTSGLTRKPVADDLGVGMSTRKNEASSFHRPEVIFITSRHNFTLKLQEK